MGRIALVGAVGVIVAGASVLAYANQPQARPLDPLGWALLLVSVAALGWVRERPEVVLLVSTLCVTGYFVLGYAYSAWPASPLIAMYTSIALGRRGWGWAGAAFLFAVPAAGVALEPVGDNIVGLVIWTLVVLTVAQLGEVSRTRRAYTAEVERRAAEAERTREEEARRRTQEERLKIARELHDVTSHTVSLIALQAAVAAEAVERAGGPEEARAALKIIRTASREALSEMKGILTVLRTDDTGSGAARPAGDGARSDDPSATRALPDRGGSAVPAAGDDERNAEQGHDPERAEAAERQPMPGLGRLRELFAGAGVDVEFRTLGEERTLPPAVELTVYRLVQEALTNTRRHAQATRAWVTLSFERDGVTVRVADDGRGAPAAPSDDATGGPAPETEDGGAHNVRHAHGHPGAHLGEGAPQPIGEGGARRHPLGHGGGHRHPVGRGGGLGLLGMRERVTAMNGRLTVGNRPGGGFQVEAWLPVEAA